MYLKYFGWPLFVMLLTACAARGQDFSNKGKEFWLAYSYHVGMVNPGGSPTMTLYLTADVNTGYKVEIFGGATVQTGNISAGQVISVTIPNSAFIDNEGKFSNKAIRVTADQPIVVYAYITRSAISAATLCLPTAVLGREYYSSNFTQVSNETNSNSFITVVAVEDNTTVEITPSAPTKNGWAAGSTYTITLNKGEIYQVLGTVNNSSINGVYTGVDLTGTKIKSVAAANGSCKKIAVFSGSGKVKIATSTCGPSTSDNLFQQLYPVVSWGLKYLTVPSYNRTKNVYRIFKTDPSAVVKLNGAIIPAAAFTNGFYYEFSNSSPNSIEADKPISVVQYFTTQGCDGNASPYDPDMIVLNPVEQNIDKVTLVSSNLYATPATSHQHHIHVIMRNTGTGISSFKFDGQPVSPSSWAVHPGNPSYSYLYLSNISQGYHRLESDSGFNAIAYGYANAESYGYSAGANVKDLYQFVSIKNAYATVNFPAACTNSPFFFNMTFPYQPTEIKWVFGTALNSLGIQDVTIPNPVYDSSWLVNGKMLYRYSLPGSYILTSAGSYPIKVIAYNSTAEGCSGEQQIDYTLQVFERPVADFSITTTGCAPDQVKFTDASTAGGRPAYLWDWKISDGRSSTGQNPVLLFNNPGNYNVTLSVITDIGCVSSPVTKPLAIHAVPVADFNVPAPLCATKAVDFVDASNTATGSINEWRWNFGDGSSFTSTTAGSLKHIYTVAGTYSVSLTVKTDKGCTSQALVKQIKVNPLPAPGFIMPGTCLSDPVTQFVDTSKISDNSQAGFSYLWNFGDPNATAANPNTSTAKDPQHKYSAIGNYNVSLNLTSAAGCTVSLTQVFTVNGAKPQSAFTIAGGNTICSNKTVSLINNSTVDFGKIVKLEIYWDYRSDPAAKTIISYPAAGGSFSHTYPEFFAPLTKDYVVQVIAYSGDNCLDASTQTLTLAATPDVYFNAVNEICEDAVPFQISSAGIQNSLPGTGQFTGRGVTASGVFNPRSAGAGTHTIRYTFTGSNGCSNFKEQTIRVKPLPLVNAGPDRFILEGGNTVLEATASGPGLTINWTPAINLSNPSVLQPTASPTDDITYKLEVSSSEGCKASDEVFVKVLKEPAIPNVFSPNGDGVNDTWVIRYLDTYPGATVKIFNRYGQAVFESRGYAKPWDGNYNGKPLPAGTYYYIIDPKNGRKQMTGFVDIIR